MAFKKSKPTPFGVDGEYHKVVLINMDLVNDEVTVGVSCFHNEQAATAGRQALGYYSIDLASRLFARFPETELTVRDMNLKAAYMALREAAQVEEIKPGKKNLELVFFADAEDV